MFDQAASDAETATRMADNVLRGSRNDDVKAARQALAAASAEVEPTRRRFDNTAKHATAYLTRLGEATASPSWSRGFSPYAESLMPPSSRRCAPGRTDAEQALAHLAGAQQGSSDQRLRAAVADTEVARDKSRRYARLLADAARHVTRYVNTIAPPGAATSGPAEEDAFPSGERLVEEAEGRSRKAEAFLRRHVKKADDSEDTLK
ncbi:hypothetical protein [Micromonospora ureilytica]|uniref:hypothetical protein n=1 Tax=Micromonospora ureilytica TaxID=709868 RepID=UPI002E111D3C|nr:hypothetical protein OHB55_24680 [Micromonospora ureilytica]